MNETEYQKAVNEFEIKRNEYALKLTKRYNDLVKKMDDGEDGGRTALVFIFAELATLAINIETVAYIISQPVGDGDVTMH